MIDENTILNKKGQEKDDRFVRIGRGTYGLKEWGIKSIKKGTRKRRK